MKYTLGTAAKATGKSRTTILRAIESGRISAQKNDIGHYQIDPAELHRVFPPKEQGNNPRNSKMERDATQDATGVTVNENVVLRKEIELLREQLEREKEQADHWRQQAERVSLLLTHEKEEKPAPGLQGLFGLLKGKTTKP